MKLPLILTALCISTNAYSATYTVTTSSDSGEGSLRALIEKANNNPGPDIIEIPAEFNAQAGLSGAADPPGVHTKARQTGKATAGSPLCR